MSVDRQANDLVIFRRLISQARPYWPHLTLLAVLQLLATPLALLVPLPLKIAVDGVIGSNALPTFMGPLIPDWIVTSASGLLLFAVALQLIVVLLLQSQELANRAIRTWTGEALTLQFRARLFRHVQGLSLLFHDTKGTADSTYRIQYDSAAIQWIMVFGIVPLITSSVMLIAMIYVIARINSDLALVALGVVPMLFIMVQIYSRRMRRPYREVKEIETNALKVIQEVLTALRVVKAFGREEGEHERFMSRSSEGMRSRFRLALAEGLLSLTVNLTTAAGTAAILYVGTRGVMAGTLTLGDLLVVFSYLTQLYAPLQTISNKVSGFRSNLASAQRAFEVLDELPEVVEKPNARRINRAQGSIEFCNVTFGYEPSTSVLHDLSFSTPAGTRLGIKGPTGSGKTTLISLLARLYDPDKGKILLDGVDLRDFKLADLRNQFAIVLQEPVLFSTTIAENIAYGRPGACQADIIAAAKAANAHKFIEQLPRGYETPVGERGMQLSGGERQRVSLARAFLKDAPVLILDEPTSSVDVHTESEIMEAMERLMRRRTTFMIAHRLSTLEKADMLLTLDGPHTRLVTSSMKSTRHAEEVKLTTGILSATPA